MRVVYTVFIVFTYEGVYTVFTYGVYECSIYCICTYEGSSYCMRVLRVVRVYYLLYLFKCPVLV